MARSFNKFENLPVADSFIKRNFDWCLKTTTRFTAFNANTMSRLANALTDMINEKKFLPKFIIIVSEDDVIKYIKKPSDYKRGIEWIMQEHINTLLKLKKIIPAKATKENEPKFLWIMPSTHKNYLKNEERIEMGEIMQQLTANLEIITALPLKQVWDENDNQLVNSRINRVTEQGLSAMWQSIDRTVRFWVIAEHKEDTKRLSAPGFRQKPKMSSNRVTCAHHHHQEHHCCGSHHYGDFQDRRRPGNPSQRGNRRFIRKQHY